VRELVAIPQVETDDPYREIDRTRGRVQGSPDDPGGHYYLGLLYYRVHEIHQATSEFGRAIECDPKFWQAYPALAHCLCAIGDYGKAERVLKEGLRVLPKSGGLYEALAYVLYCDPGRRRTAVAELQKSIRLEDDRKQRKKLKKVLETWERDLPPSRASAVSDEWFMARKDCHRSSCVSHTGFNEPPTFRPGWRYRYKEPIDQGFLPDIPCPVVAGDMLVVADSSMRSFVGINLETGESVWKSGIVTNRLTYASTPVYASQSLLFAGANSIRRISLNTQRSSVESVSGDETVAVVPYCAPLGYDDCSVVVFGLKEHVFVYDYQESEPQLAPVEGGQDLRSPVVCAGQFVLLSRDGGIHTLLPGGIPERLTGSAASPYEGIYSTPCVVGSNVYFEMLDSQGRRRVCAYNVQKQSWASTVIEGEICSPDHAHLDFSPLVYRDGVVVASDVDPRVYRAWRVGDSGMLEVVPLDIAIASGPLRVVRLSHVFSTVIDSYLLSNTQRGFFYASLEGGGGGVEVIDPPSEPISQPVVYRNKVFFLRQDGVRCYLIE
jgi:tetratricopeptide (TPR) repeat protein